MWVFINLQEKFLECFSKIFFKYKVIGVENIPNEGNIIIAANHKSNLDPIFLAAAIENREVAAISKKELVWYQAIRVYFKEIKCYSYK